MLEFESLDQKRARDRAFLNRSSLSPKPMRSVPMQHLEKTRLAPDERRTAQVNGLATKNRLPHLDELRS
jgi:hypothetical protein